MSTSNLAIADPSSAAPYGASDPLPSTSALTVHPVETAAATSAVLVDPKLPAHQALIKTRRRDGGYEVGEAQLVLALRAWRAAGDLERARRLSEVLVERCMPTFRERASGLRHRPELMQDAIAGMIEQLLREAQDPSEPFMTLNFIHYLRCLCADNFGRVLRQEGLSYRRDEQGRPAGRPMHVPQVLVRSLDAAPVTPLSDGDEDAVDPAILADMHDAFGEWEAESEAQRILETIPDPIDRVLVTLRVLRGHQWDTVSEHMQNSYHFARAERTLRQRFSDAVHIMRRAYIMDRIREDPGVTRAALVRSLARSLRLTGDAIETTVDLLIQEGAVREDSAGLVAVAAAVRDGDGVCGDHPVEPETQLAVVPLDAEACVETPRVATTMFVDDASAVDERNAATVAEMPVVPVVRRRARSRPRIRSTAPRVQEAVESTLVARTDDAGAADEAAAEPMIPAVVVWPAVVWPRHEQVWSPVYQRLWMRWLLSARADGAPAAHVVQQRLPRTSSPGRGHTGRDTHCKALVSMHADMHRGAYRVSVRAPGRRVGEGNPRLRCQVTGRARSTNQCAVGMPRARSRRVSRGWRALAWSQQAGHGGAPPTIGHEGVSALSGLPGRTNARAAPPRVQDAVDVSLAKPARAHERACGTRGGQRRLLGEPRSRRNTAAVTSAATDRMYAASRARVPVAATATGVPEKVPVGASGRAGLGPPGRVGLEPTSPLSSLCLQRLASSGVPPGETGDTQRVIRIRRQSSMPYPDGQLGGHQVPVLVQDSRHRRLFGRRGRRALPSMPGRTDGNDAVRVTSAAGRQLGPPPHVAWRAVVTLPVGMRGLVANPTRQAVA